MLKEIVTYIKNNTTGFTVGTNLFAGFVPATILDNYVVVRETGGAPNFYLTDKMEKAIQVLSKSTNYWTARDNAVKVYNCLHGIAGITLPVVETAAYYIDTAQATVAPQELGQDEKGLFEISTNYIVRIRDA